MPSGGRFGYKCIPAHTTCEVYHNTSGAEASITFATQVLDAENSVDINVAITDGQCTLTCCSALYTSGTSGAKNLIGVHNRGEYQGAFFRGRGDNELNYSRVGRYTFTDGTNYCPGATFTAVPYGGNEVILPGSTDLLTITECYTEKSPYCYNVTWSCDGLCPYFVNSVHNDCKDCNEAKRFVNVYNNTDSGPYSFEFTSSSRCSIEASTYDLFEATKSCRNTFEGAANSICHWVVNHYGTPVTGDTSTLNTPASTITKTCSCVQRAQAVVMGLDQGANPSYNWMAWSRSLSSNYITCAPLQTISTCVGLNNCCSGVFWNNLCCLIGGGDPLVSTTVINKAIWCCNTQTSQPMSPYGVQRAATYGVVTWAFCNSDQGTGYYFGYPRGCMPWGVASATNAQCSCGLGVWVNVPHTHCCEYPMKYLAHDPNTCRTFTMIRSCMNNNCGIYEINYEELYQMTQTNCGGYFGCTQNIRPLPAMQWTGVEYEEGNNQFFTKVADFPKEMTEAKYENANGQMCVSCIYKYGPTHWSLQVYNHTDSAWDTFTTTDLYTWDRENNLSLNLSDEVKVYKIDDSCVVNYTDQFDENVPKGTIIDYGVRSNAYERSGIILSNGDAIVIKNDGDYPISAQVWGFEG